MDWRAPDYAAIFQQRLQNLERLREAVRQDPDVLDQIKTFYRDNPEGIADFISDWGVTYEPRNPEIGLPAIIPFVLWPQQRDLVSWIVNKKWKGRERGLIEKSRDWGVSWITIAVACTLCLLYDGLTIGFGSRKEEYVDKTAAAGGVKAMKALLPRARIFMAHLPKEFRGGWLEWRDAPHMRIGFPETQSIITGEAGDQIGRGDRTSLYIVDEHAYIERAELVDAALSMTTNCQIDVSSVCGMSNAFAQKRHSGKVDVWVCDWKDDPRKDQAWYDKQVEDLDPVIVAQEIDRDYMASVEGVVIPAKWLNACVGALESLGMAPAGERMAALDVADEGKDKNALVGGTGVLIDVIEQWSGKDSDTFYTAQRAFDLCDEHGFRRLRYDADGGGSFMRGDFRVINEQRMKEGLRALPVEGYRGSDAVVDPEGIVEGTARDGDKGRMNKDFFANRKAQQWWAMRRRALNTYRWVVEKKPCSADEILSIDPKHPLAKHLVTELGQATKVFNGAGKMVVNKTPEGMKSPNLADGAVMRMAKLGRPPLQVPADVVRRVSRIVIPRRPMRY